MIIMVSENQKQLIEMISQFCDEYLDDEFKQLNIKLAHKLINAPEISINRGKIENINNLFGIKVYSSNEKPTNGEFIALVADKMLIEGA